MNKMSFLILFAAAASLLTSPAFAQQQDETAVSSAVVKDSESGLEEIDPFDPNVEELLQRYDEVYEQETGLPAHLDESMYDGLPFNKADCRRKDCTVYLQIVKSSQTAYLYVNGWPQGTFKVSTGVSGHGTPNFDTHPNGRIYDRYTSTKYPEGDYNGLGNMPYAVFISGGFAVHGTPQGNWRRLGTPASHGCVRMHPDNAYYFNRLVRQYGVRNTWITIQ